MRQPLKIGNAQAFWGDRSGAAATLAAQQPDLDFLTLDYLAEVSMSILAIQREKNPSLGYAQDFVEVIRSLIPHWKNGSPIKVITNAGGLNPAGCALACKQALEAGGCPALKIGYITGDDIYETLLHAPDETFTNLDTGASIGSVKSRLKTANAYLGSKAIVEALKAGADIVITGRIADPCLTAAPCIAHYGWRWEEYDKIAGAVIAGHLIECGTQVTGGFSTHWLSIPAMTEPGYPIIEMSPDGSFVVTKPAQSDGEVTLKTVKEQLLYEIQDPNRYLCPDVVASLLSVKLSEEGKDRIKIEHVKGSAPPSTLKVSATYSNGYKIESMIALFGRNCKQKGIRCGEIIHARLLHAGFNVDDYLVECLGSGDVVPGIGGADPMEVMLRISARSQTKEALEYLSKEIAPLVTSGPQGITGYTSGRPKVRPVFSFWPTLIPESDLKTTVKILEAGVESRPARSVTSPQKERLPSQRKSEDALPQTGSKTLYEIAYARSGDKGSNANVALFAYTAKGYEYLCKHVTEESVKAHFHALPITKVERYLMPNLWAINYVLYGALGEGGSGSLRIDNQGKALGQALLEQPLKE